MNRNANRNTAAFDRWMSANTTPETVIQPVKGGAGRLALAFFALAGVVAVAIPALQILGAM
jgi:hypothetical protein